MGSRADGAPGPAERRSTAFDIATILAAIAVSSAAYVLSLGYYADDWAFLEILHKANDQSFAGLYAAMAREPMLAVRPGQILWWALFHRLAPADPRLAHLANHAVFAAAALLIYGALRRLPGTRASAYHITLLYVCLPTYAAAKLWLANHQATLSLFFFALTLFLVARLPGSQGRKRLALIAGAFLASLAADSCYGLFAFVLLALPLFAWTASGNDWRTLHRDRGFAAATLALTAALAIAAAFKLSYHYGAAWPKSPTHFVLRAGWMYLRAAYTCFWTLGLYLPRLGIGMLSNSVVPGVALASTALTTVVLALLESVRARAPRLDAGDAAQSLSWYLVAGAIAWVLGYAAFLPNFFYANAPIGEQTRGNIAGAVGVALIAYAALRLLARRWGRLARAALVLFCSTGILVQTATGAMWAAAVPTQDKVANYVMQRVPATFQGTLVLYGFCPYRGAGPIYPYGWDLASRLHVAGYSDKLAVRRIRQQTEARPEGLFIRISPRVAGLYPYRDLAVLNRFDGSLTRLGSPAAARAFFARHPVRDGVGCDYTIEVGQPLY